MASGCFFTQVVTDGTRKEGEQLLGRQAPQAPSPPTRNVFPPTNSSELNPFQTVTPPPPHPSQKGSSFYRSLTVQCCKKEPLPLIKTRHRTLGVLAEKNSGREASWKEGVMPPDSLTCS